MPEQCRQQDQSGSQQEQQNLSIIVTAQGPNQFPEPLNSHQQDSEAAEQQSSQSEDGKKGVGGSQSGDDHADKGQHSKAPSTRPQAPRE